VSSRYLSFTSIASVTSRRRINRLIYQVSLILACLTLAFASGALQPEFAFGQKKSQPAPEKTGAGDVARGKYIVESVAMCGQCHTPRDSQGNPDRGRWLQGGSLPFAPATADPNWPVSAPRIGGNPPANDADMVKLLTTGIWVTGNRLRFPMPQFRMDRGDAEAVVAYLKSVPARQ
jgi:mono/diheme cytochrome c family protein